MVTISFPEAAGKPLLCVRGHWRSVWTRWPKVLSLEFITMDRLVLRDVVYPGNTPGEQVPIPYMEVTMFTLGFHSNTRGAYHHWIAPEPKQCLEPRSMLTLPPLGEIACVV